MSHDRFQTSREVYHRIRWDPRLDAHEFFVGYDARGEQLEEVPFSAFVPDGEIPWHRVWYFRRGSQKMWDRRERIDRMSTLSLEPVEVSAPPAPPRLEPAPEFTPLSGYRYDPRAAAWVSGASEGLGGPAVSPPEQLTVATFNVLFDLYDPELLDTPRRTRATLSLLRSVDADLIALQEVTAPFLRALLDLPWVREHYVVSDGPAAETVETYGQVLLSRHPFASLRQCVFSRDKRILLGELAFAGGPLWVAAPHLTSDRVSSGPAARKAQIEALVEWSLSLDSAGPEAPDALVLGDFNLDDASRELEDLATTGFVDVWPTLRPGEEGFTFDPSRNTLAALTTSSSRSKRVDRLLVRSSTGRLVPREIRLFGETPLSGPPAPKGGALFASDHFGVSCVLDRRSVAERGVAHELPVTPLRVLTSPRDHQTALVLIPPEELWAPIQALREVHDSKVERWMPHVTLLYPFVPEERFGDAEAAITSALGNLPPFEVSLEDFGFFEHRSSVTAWLRPEAKPQGALQSLHAALVPVFSWHEEKEHDSERSFTPHLSVGQLPRASAAQTRGVLASWERDWRPLRFQVGEVCLISRRGDQPFEVRRRVPLGGRGRSVPRAGDPLASVLAAREALPSREARRAREAVVGRLQELCTRLGAELHPYGSYLLGTDTAASDVDAVAIGPASLSREDFAHALEELLAEKSPTASVRFVADSALQLVKLSFEGVAFDVSYARQPEGVVSLSPAELLALHAERLDPISLRALNGWTDTRAVLDAVEREGAGLERFRSVLCAVRTWAKARGVYSHALGYLGGLSWSVMVAWACTRAPREAARSEAGVLAYFFETFAAWPWPKPVTLTAQTARYVLGGQRDLLPVVAPTLPLRNTARNVSRSTRQVLGDELSRARERVRRALAEPSRDAWAALFEPADFAREFPMCLKLSIGATSSEARERAAGWVLGHLTALLYRLEAERGLFVRPLPQGSPEGPFLIGLSSREPGGTEPRPGSALGRALEDFRASFQQWSARPEGATLCLERG